MKKDLPRRRLKTIGATFTEFEQKCENYDKEAFTTTTSKYTTKRRSVDLAPALKPWQIDSGASVGYRPPMSRRMTAPAGMAAGAMPSYKSPTGSVESKPKANTSRATTSHGAAAERASPSTSRSTIGHPGETKYAETTSKTISL